MGLIGLIGLMSLMGLMGCSGDDEEVRRQGTTVELAPYVTSYAETETTRAGEIEWPPEGFKPYNEMSYISDEMKLRGQKAAICTYFTSVTNGTNKAEARRFRRDGTGKWVIDLEVAANSYYLYGIVPFSALSDTTSSNVITPNGSSYAEGATMTLNLNSVMNQDVCIVVGAKHGTKGEGENAQPEPVSQPKPGDFGCTIDMGNTSYIFLLFDHLYAAMCFRMRVGSDYAALRTIRLKELDLKIYNDEACTSLMKKKVSTTVNLQANNTGAWPFSGDIVFTPDESSDDMDWMAIYQDEDPQQPLPTGEEWSERYGFIPYTNSDQYYILRSRYDVYDKEGNLIRKDCTAENKIKPREKFNKTRLERGKIYTLKITVEPTYLYVLSDPDLDSPTMKIE